jgi:hypothetical protein
VPPWDGSNLQHLPADGVERLWTDQGGLREYIRPATRRLHDAPTSAEMARLVGMLQEAGLVEITTYPRALTGHVDRRGEGGGWDA